MEEQFFALAPRGDEGSAQFVLRVEMERRKLNMDLNATFHAFVKGLDYEIKGLLDVVRLNKKATGKNNGSITKFGWEDVVCVCKDRASGVQLQRPILTAVAPAMVAAPPPAHTHAGYIPPPARYPPVAAGHSHGPGGHSGGHGGLTNGPGGPQHSGNRHTCDLCVKLGMGGDNHKREWCFACPKSKAYKPEVRKRKVAQARARGIPIPPEIDFDDAAPGGQNLVS